MSSCWPWFSAPYRQLAAESWTKAIIPSGCSVGGDGNIPCSPESMRAKAEVWLAQHAPQALATIGGRLSLDVYTFARYMHSELGSGTVEERVAVGEALRNRARMGRTIYQLLTPSGYYGPIHASDDYCTAHGYDCTSKHNVCCAPYKRWAATSRDPSVMTLLLAALVAGGASGDSTHGADDQAAVNTTSWVRYLAKNGKYWVGPLPGIDHRRTFLTFTPDALTRSVAGDALLQRGLDAIGQPPPAWETLNLPTCGKVTVSSRAQTFLLSMAGLAVGTLAATLVARRYVHPA